MVTNRVGTDDNPVKECRECGAMLADDQAKIRHQNWHIELLKMWNLTQRSKTIVMVTHDIEEAVFLSDRIVVMNNGPAATIREIEEVHLPRPRNKKDIVNQEEYKVIRERLLSLLMDKVEIDEKDFYKEKAA